MKKSLPLIYLLAFIAAISGYMIHKISWIARIGINWFYKEYGIFKSWGKTSLLEFMIFMLLLAIHTVAHKYLSRQKAMMVHAAGIVIALIGLYFTYHDFRNDLSHRIAGERFHIGFYLFWLGWIVIALRFIIKRDPTKEIAR